MLERNEILQHCIDLKYFWMGQIFMLMMKRQQQLQWLGEEWMGNDEDLKCVCGHSVARERVKSPSVWFRNKVHDWWDWCWVFLHWSIKDIFPSVMKIKLGVTMQKVLPLDGNPRAPSCYPYFAEFFMIKCLIINFINLELEYSG